MFLLAKVTEILHALFVIQHLEYAVQFLSSSYIKDQYLLEGLQWRETKQMSGRWVTFGAEKKICTGSEEFIEIFKILDVSQYYLN